MKNTIKVLVMLLILLGVAIGATLLILRNSRPANQPIVLSNGTVLRFLGTTVGTNHVYGSKLWNFVSNLPAPLSKPALRLMGRAPFPNQIQSARTNLVIWFEQRGAGGGPATARQVMLKIPGSPFSGETDSASFWLPAGQSNRVHSVSFQSWPRRVEQLECVILERDATHQNVPIGSFLLDSPSRNDAQALSPDPRPAVQQAGDLKVTLLRFATGIGNSTTHRWNAEKRQSEVVHPPASTNEAPHSLVRLRFDSPRGTNETWQMFNAELSDGTGNHVGATSRSGMTDSMVFKPVLWPDEPAWKVRLHLKRKEGFAGNELLSFTNIAIPAPNTTNVVNQTNSLGGIGVVLNYLIARPPLKDPRSWSTSDLGKIRLEHDDLGETNQIDLVSVIVQPMGTNLTTRGSSWSGTYHEYSLQSFPSDATHLDLVFAVQQARFVEFNVAPNWVTNEYVLKE